MNKVIILLRGLPGSGKTTFARELEELLGHGSEVVAADDYFYNAEGEYVFDINHLFNAHSWCQRQVKAAMEAGKPIVVHNTFTTEKEIMPYTDMATLNGYKVISLIVENRHGSESIHGVPPETMEKMEKRFSVKLRKT